MPSNWNTTFSKFHRDIFALSRSVEFPSLFLASEVLKLISLHFLVFIFFFSVFAIARLYCGHKLFRHCACFLSPTSFDELLRYEKKTNANFLSFCFGALFLVVVKQFKSHLILSQSNVCKIASEKNEPDEISLGDKKTKQTCLPQTHLEITIRFHR